MTILAANLPISQILSEYNNSQPAQFLQDGTRVVLPPLSEAFRKSQHLLGFTIDSLFLRTPISYVLFVTLTSAKPLLSVKQGHVQLNKLFNQLRRRGREYLYVLEPQESGRIHYHLLIPVDFDAHEGTIVDAWKDRGLFSDEFRDNSMNPRLRAESEWWKATASRYGFGRIEVAPIYSNAEAIRKYLTKQNWRHRHWPFEEKKSVRFWSCSTALRAGRSQFAWNSPGGQTCRARQREWAHQQGCEAEEELPIKLGKNWGYQFYQHVEYLRTLDRLGMASPPIANGSREGTTADGRFSGRADGVEEDVTQAGLAPGPMMGVGSVGADDACGGGRDRPHPPRRPGGAKACQRPWLEFSSLVPTSSLASGGPSSLPPCAFSRPSHPANLRHHEHITASSNN